MRIFDSRTFGEVIRLRRRELGYTQQDIADFTGMSVSFLSDLERGKQTAELGKALLLANTLGLNCELNRRDDGNA